MIDLALLAVFAGVTYCVAAEGALGATATLLVTLFAGLLAMNYFEPLAGVLERNVAFFRGRADEVALLGLFVALVFGGRLACEAIAPSLLEVHSLAYEGLRWVCGAGTGYVTAALLLVAVHTAPFPRSFYGFSPDRANLFGALAPDRDWIGFTHHVTGGPFAKTQLITAGDRTAAVPKAFDGRTALHWGVDQTQTGGVPPELVVMPSFVVRYADRRAAGGFGVAAGGAAGPPAPPRQAPSQPAF